ncbi:MAG TPA: dTMP kinase [Candidatus Hypogeohydataceae bacterium YC41]
MAGKLITIEGIDGSGKTVQGHLLMERFIKEGRPAEVIKFPRRGETFFGKMVERYLQGEFGNAKDVNPHLAAILYAGDRYEVKGRINQCLQEGKTVIARRYVDSNKAHQGGKFDEPQRRKYFFEWLDELEYKILGNPRPNLCLYLDVPAKVACDLIKKRRKELPKQELKKDIHEEDVRHLEAAERAYRELAQGGGWVSIQCVKDGKLLREGEIADKVWEAVKRAGI